jgi:hypothetical protein
MMAIIGLIVNLLFLPWLGTLIMKRKEWISIFILWIVGIVLSFVLVGIPLLIIAWVWGLVIGVKEVHRTM